MQVCILTSHANLGSMLPSDAKIIGVRPLTDPGHQKHLPDTSIFKSVSSFGDEPLVDPYIFNTIPSIPKSSTTPTRSAATIAVNSTKPAAASQVLCAPQRVRHTLCAY